MLTWTTYLFAGLAVGRSDLRRVGSATRLLVLGLVAAVTAKAASAWLLAQVGGVERLARTVGSSAGAGRRVARGPGMFGTTPREDWRWLVVSAPHSGTTLDLVHTTGSALAVLGACLLLVRVLPRLVVLPFAAAGSMTLTLYTAHVLALADGSPFLSTDRTRLWWAHVLVGLAVATVWRTSGRPRPARGPARLALRQRPACRRRADRCDRRVALASRP